jgi:hypothetical protein
MVPIMRKCFFNNKVMDIIAALAMNLYPMKKFKLFSLKGLGHKIELK